MELFKVIYPLTVITSLLLMTGQSEEITSSERSLNAELVSPRGIPSTANLVGPELNPITGQPTNRGTAYYDKKSDTHYTVRPNGAVHGPRKGPPKGYNIKPH